MRKISLHATFDLPVDAIAQAIEEEVTRVMGPKISGPTPREREALRLLIVEVDRVTDAFGAFEKSVHTAGESAARHRLMQSIGHLRITRQKYRSR